MMPLLLGELAHLLNEGERLAKVSELERPLDAVSLIAQVPLRHLDVEELCLHLCERGNAASTGGASFVSEGFGHGGDYGNAPAENEFEGRTASDKHGPMSISEG
jgi:hypothetical protein